MSSNIPLQTKAEPELIDLLNLFKTQLLTSFSAHHIGTVQSFDAAKQTATATINYKKTYFQKVDGVYGPVLVDYPILLDCPVICLGGGAGALTFPIEEGDECLVLFNDRDIDNWFAGGTGGPVATPRLHSFSDGIILVGVRSLANVLTDYDPARAVLKNGMAMVGVGDPLIKIANDVTTLKTVINDLIDIIIGLMTLPTIPASPTTLSPATIAALTAHKAVVGSLLE